MLECLSFVLIKQLLDDVYLCTLQIGNGRDRFSLYAAILYQLTDVPEGYTPQHLQLQMLIYALVNPITVQVNNI